MIYLRPVDGQYPVSQRFGENPHLYPSTNGHNGIDYGLPEGSRIYAAADGVIIRAELDTQTAANPRTGYGIHVRIQHADGSMTIYGHLSALLVKTGQKVAMGEPIGLAGNTGRSTGPHLHFELRTRVDIAGAVDPAQLIVDEIPDAAGLFMATLTPEGIGLRVRTKPAATGANGVIRSLKPGEQVRVLGLAGEDCWLWIDDGYVKYDPTWLAIEKGGDPVSVVE